MYYIRIAALLLFSFSIAETTYAQYPQVPDDVKMATNKMMDAAYAHSDSMWQLALPIIEKEAAEGRPYIPWAKRPYDLPQASIPAFPGAEGGGMYSFGGRGGKVITVTSLADSGPGTLREACETGGARIVVFNVAGIIRLKSPLMIRAPYITIAGQTAPGDGVCVAGESFWIDTHDVVIRHMRFRRGETNVGRRDDAIGGNTIGNIMIDHVSASWGLDENMSMYRHMYDDGTGKPTDEKLPTVNITIQNSIFSEALDTWNHSFGSTLGGENCSFMRNLWANNTGRNPSIGWYGIFNFVNNVVFNWMHRSIDGGDYRAMYNIVNNYFKPGPVTNLERPISHRILKPESGRSRLDHLVFGRAYVEGNVVENNKRVTNDNWAGGVQVEDMANAGEYRDQIKWDQPLPMPEMTILDAKSAYKFVLENAGATLPKRDPVDERIVRVVRTGEIEYAADAQPSEPQFKHRRLPPDSYKLGIITEISQVGGYPEYQGEPYQDSDMDGMPDEYEKQYAELGLDPNDPKDAQQDCNGDGYTNIEKYINGIDPTKKIDWSNTLNNFDTLTASRSCCSN
ncbi:pectate lyase family protein [Flavilitoribacter nigricans]|uniref:Polysaccharide lyase n=1 Tax=Flavilitoribacter nigricans (strain ATCC 23147 / DSM 23189 / NBRC 102662 / NCIMB 1420 / SS-2) TaxID=1122177 RepID=A0A2D0N1N4_FLAN2|nr:polysaccharide lyase [Flavilitoribacter nigricans]PHN02441.1 polysaccharide lyase [Flavilitoribacter nigricans DSM 23189 = NBRC 102662]